MKPFHVLLLVFGLMMIPRARAEFVVESESVYHPAVATTSYVESWPMDRGGVLEVFVRNMGTQPASLTGVELNGVAPESFAGVKWWRFWPETVAPGDVATLTVKSTGAPLEPGAEVTVTVLGEHGEAASNVVACGESVLRLGAVLVSPDFRSVYLYARNDGSQTISVDEIRINGEVATPTQPGRLEALGGSWIVPAGGLRIFRARWSAPIAPLTPLASRLIWHDVTDPGSGSCCAGGLVRVTRPEFLLGTWSTDLRDDPGRTVEARALGINANLPGGQRYDTVRELAETAFLSHSLTYGAGTLAATTVQAAAGATGFHGWFLRDEPDLSPGENPSGILAQENRLIWQNDPGHPTWINLATTAAYNEYATFTDIACMDHYAMFGAFTNIPGTWLIRVSDMEEALEWTRLLKRNVEPRPIWSWAQLCSSTWWGQPEPWGVNYQFWAHVMEGAKSVFWFGYGPGDQDREEYAPAVQMAARAYRQFAPVRTLCYYGEPLQPSAVEPDAPLIARLLAGPAGAVAVVLNNNYRVGGSTPLQPVYERGSASGWVEFTLPDWITPEEVWRVTETGREMADWYQAGDAIRLQVTLGPEETGVFTIGPRDRVGPEPVSPVMLTWAGAGRPALRWAEPRDNVGVWRYEVFRNGMFVGETAEPAWMLDAGMDWRDGYAVRAVDAAGNQGGLSPTARLGQYDFPVAGWGMGWKAVSGATSQRVESGRLVAASDGGTLRVQGPAVTMPAASAPWALMVMDLPSGASARLEWQRADAPSWDSARRVMLSAWSGKATTSRVFAVDLSANGEWQGTISRTRIVVTGLSAGQEAALELARFNPEGPDADADGDGLKDGEEYLLKTDPFSMDSDRDGLSDGDETLAHGTDPTRPDTDGDGLSDREELRWGSDPLDLLDTAAVPVGSRIFLVLLLLLGARVGLRHA